MIIGFTIQDFCADWCSCMLATLNLWNRRQQIFVLLLSTTTGVFDMHLKTRVQLKVFILDKLGGAFSFF